MARDGRVVRVLGRLAAARGLLPREIVLDNGPEQAGRAVDQRAYEQGVRLRVIDPGKPAPSAAVESFDGRLGDECLNQHGFLSLADARRNVEEWRADSSRVRRHSGLGYRSLEEFRLGLDLAAARPQG